MDCTEKILCFIAAGKWILTQSYLKNCIKQNELLDEEQYHVSKRFNKSKLAVVSLKWKLKINESIENSPFYNWNVACLISEEDKARSLIRIIKAGHGNASIPNCRSLSNRFTLVIFDKTTRSDAVELSKISSIPCYPYQCIPDYIMQVIAIA